MNFYRRRTRQTCSLVMQTPLFDTSKIIMTMNISVFSQWYRARYSRWLEIIHCPGFSFFRRSKMNRDLATRLSFTNCKFISRRSWNFKNTLNYLLSFTEFYQMSPLCQWRPCGDSCCHTNNITVTNNCFSHSLQCAGANDIFHREHAWWHCPASHTEDGVLINY